MIFATLVNYKPVSITEETVAPDFELMNVDDKELTLTEMTNRPNSRTKGMLRAGLILFLLICQPIQADDEGPIVYHSSSLGGSLARPLSFYTENLPVPGLIEKDGSLSPLQWKKANDSGPHISIDRVEHFPGQICAVSYLSQKYLKLGVIKKRGILLLVPDNQGNHTVAYYQDAGTGDLVETYTLETLKLLEDEPFLSLTCHFSGTGGHRETQYFRWKNFKLTPHTLWARKPDLHQEIKKAGWQLWHRGHWRNPSEMASYNTVYRDPKNAKGDRSGHATIKTSYQWVNEQLTAKSWEVLPENWNSKD